LSSRRFLDCTSSGAPGRLDAHLFLGVVGTPCRWELSRLLNSIRGRQAAKAKRELAGTVMSPVLGLGAGLKGSLRESMCQAAMRILRARARRRQGWCRAGPRAGPPSRTVAALRRAARGARRGSRSAPDTRSPSGARPRGRRPARAELGRPAGAGARARRGRPTASAERRCDPWRWSEPDQVHPPPQPFPQRPLVERGKPQRRHQLAAAELGQKTRVDLVRLRRQRRDRLHLARISDLDLPAASDELVAHPEHAAHHLQARGHVIAQFQDEASEPVPISADPAPADDLAANAERAPLRLPIRPIESDILHLGPPSRWDSSPESVSGEEALLHDIP
jgi:hypothetical protein